MDVLRRICRNLDIDAAIERSRSGHGAHLWIFFREMVPARLARRFGFALLEKGAEAVNLKSFKYYDRMIPAQDALPEGGLGNLIALPLQGLALKSGNSAFVDENWNVYEDQLKTLAGIRRLTKKEIKGYLTSWCGTESDSADDESPWDRGSKINDVEVKGIVHIVLADRIYIDSSGMSNKVKRQLRRLATFSNRQYFQNQAMDIPNYDNSRFIYLGCDDGKYIVLPRGLKDEILVKFDESGIRYSIEDKRSSGLGIKVSFKGELKPSQVPAVEAMLENETGILHAATAFGKTVVCCNMIARRGVNTLILVDRADLMRQWIARLEEFLEINEELPEYTTKTGQTRKRKKLIGNLQGAHDSLTDLEKAKSQIVISSPRLNTQKVNRLISVLELRQELGVKVTVVTWHPDAYRYGRDEVRMGLIEKLRRAGFEMKLCEESCEHYAVIDNEIVWYGSVNLLSKEDIEDNLMRVCSKEIAAELLEMTFSSES